MTDPVQQTPPNPRRDPSKMALGMMEVCLLFGFYGLAIIVSGYLLVESMLSLDVPDKITETATVFLLMQSAVCGASIYYARKLYKAGINQEYNFRVSGLDVSRISTLAYYVIRVPVSALVALVVFALWHLSVNLASEGTVTTAISSKYLFLVMGFFSGFSAGKFIEFFEKEGFRLARNAQQGDDNGSN
ncbi:hypothetical protein [Devosia ginsengisoli]|uniref:hypothetical protein n=1 Tax=Devosia ginsengisoli TaxID=400770 RepID=UPI0026EE399B|nr:hypothetical protein [Devosia ginsengisoli]MCR6672731.1 hypothetical protein [Devosia ginsengisoli]